MSASTAVILLGGRATRMWPITETMPKGLLPLAGRPFLEYQLDRLAAIGIEEAFLAVGRHHQRAWERYAALRTESPAVHLSIEKEPLDTAGPVTALLDRLGESFLVLNGDVIFDTSLRGFLDRAPHTAAVLALVEVPDPSAYGVVVTSPDHVVEAFVEKPRPGTEPCRSVSAGVYLIERRAFARYRTGRLSFERVVFPDLVLDKELAGIVVEGTWLDIGTPDSYLAAHADLLAGSTQPQLIDETAVVEGSVEGSWAVIAAGATIDSGSVVSESVVLDGARIHEGAVVDRAIIGWGAEVFPGARVAESTMVGAGAIVGPGCELRYGARIAADAKLGPHAVTFSPLA